MKILLLLYKYLMSKLRRKKVIVTRSNYNRVDPDECLIGSTCTFAHSCVICNCYRPKDGRWQERIKYDMVTKAKA
jgi:hypothetical protein